jgi:replicative DNA helicase
MEQCPTETMLIAMMFAQPHNMPEAAAWLENKPDFFQIPNNQHLYEVLMHLRKEGKVIDYISVSLLLSKHIANPMEYLISLDSAVLGMTDIYTPMLMATESYLLRKLHAVTNKATSAMMNKTAHPLEVLDSLTIDVEGINRSMLAKSNKKIDKLMGELLKDLIERKEGRKNLGISSGWGKLDAVLGMLMPSTLNILAARPAMGKTAFTVNWAVQIAKQGKKVAFFSLEMSADELAARILAAETGVSNGNIMKNPRELLDSEVKALFAASDHIKDLPLHIIDAGMVNINVVNAEVDRIKPDVVFIDYLQIMTPQNSVQAGDTNKFFEDLTRDLKITSKRLNIPIVLLSQLNRSLETRTNKRPILSDIRSSGGIEQNADTVTFVHREAYFNPQADRKAAELIVAKNRNGMCGTAEMYFYDHLTKFTDLPIFPPKFKDDDQTPF